MGRVSSYFRAPWTLAIVALLGGMFVAQRLSGTWSGNVTNLQHALNFSWHGLAHGQWWRIVTPNLTNGPTWREFGPPGFRHLLFNVFGLLLAGPAVERTLGGVRYTVLVVLSGAVAFGWLVVPLPLADNFDGTSGAVYGIIGAFAALTAWHPPTPPLERFLVFGVALFALGGVVDQGAVTVEIHAAGFVAGAVLGLVFARVHRSSVVWAAALGTVLALLVVVAVRQSEISKTERRLTQSERPANPGGGLFLRA